MTQAKGVSTIHETIFENRFGYVKELRKLGARIDFFQPKISNPEKIYNFNVEEDTIIRNQAIKIHSDKTLHNGVLRVTDLRAGATLIIGAAIAQGESIIEGASIIDRGYEKIDETLRGIGMEIKRI
jgi:UDP-N-acetylglucosamine 1-carboxyvinyltransferase